MKSFLANFWVRILAGVALALLAQSSARAGCGDYVTVGQESSDHGRPGKRQAHPEKPPCQQGSQPGQAPCHGPRCGNNQAPAPVPPTTSPVRAHDFAFLLQRSLVTQSEPIPYWVGQDHLARIHRAFLIFHPPRPV